MGRRFLWGTVEMGAAIEEGICSLPNYTPPTMHFPKPSSCALTATFEVQGKFNIRTGYGLFGHVGPQTGRG